MTTRIVIVDDSPIVHTVLAQIATRYCDAEIVGNAALGQQGFDLIQQLRPDITLLDLHLPDVQGMDLLDRIRCGSHRTRVIIVSASAEADPGETQQCLAHGADACFDKRRILSDGQALALLIEPLRPQPSSNAH